MNSNNADDSTHRTLFSAGPAQPIPRSASVIVIHGEALGKRIHIDQLPILIGRSQDASLLYAKNQFNLLALLYENSGEVVSREALIEAVWEEDTRWVTEQAFDALLRRLRDRLDQIDPDYDYIVTVRGHGLRLQNEPH